MSSATIVRPRVFLDINIGTEPAGRLVIELFVDKTPKTSENFRALCTASGPNKTLSYKLSPFHRVIDEFMIQGGDITKGDGTGGESIYGGDFEDENIGWRAIDKEGLVCMANRGKGTNSSQFFITLAPCEHLNAKHTIFGHIISGQQVLDRIAKVSVDENDRPSEAILIAHCGELERRKKAAPPVPTNSTAAKLPRVTAPDPTPDPDAEDRRGRKRRKRSPSSSRSPSHSPTGHDDDDDDHHHHHKIHPSHKHRLSPTVHRPPKNRRRSDHSLDSTLRGRSRPHSRSPPPPLPPKTHRSPQSPPARKHRRQRSRSPSRAEREKSGSPHLRRRAKRSRSRSRGRKRGGRYERWYHPYAEGARRRVDEEAIRREEAEREGGEGRFEGIIEEEDGEDPDRYVRDHEREISGYGGGFKDGRGGYRDMRRYGGVGRDEGRLGGAAAEDGDGADVKFKGRGSMKFREKRW
ncbi:MAG: hypothetical protein M1827_004024 [Pycnora praestabilis]|nr:MAG: hypothetical protein M1827_004024 [Pycnora praestabilis]